jgi:hypothetical protein
MLKLGEINSFKKSNYTTQKALYWWNDPPAIWVTHDIMGQWLNCVSVCVCVHSNALKRKVKSHLIHIFKKYFACVWRFISKFRYILTSSGIYCMLIKWLPSGAVQKVWLQSLVQIQAISQPAVIGGPIGRRTNGQVWSGFGWGRPSL